MSERFNVADIFGENVFNDTIMKERLPKNVYKNLKLTMEGVNLTNKNAYGIFPYEKSEVILKNTKIKAGVYALGTNASTAQVNSPLISISALLL